MNLQLRYIMLLCGISTAVVEEFIGWKEATKIVYPSFCVVIIVIVVAVDVTVSLSSLLLLKVKL